MDGRQRGGKLQREVEKIEVKLQENKEDVKQVELRNGRRSERR